MTMHVAAQGHTMGKNNAAGLDAPADGREATTPEHCCCYCKGHRRLGSLPDILVTRCHYAAGLGVTMQQAMEPQVETQN